MRGIFTALALLLLAASMSVAGSIEVYVGNISPLIDPAKLSTLGKRGANPRVRKYVYWLGVARQNKTDPRQVATQAVRDAGYEGEAATLTLNAMLRNLDIATQLGCFDTEGMEELRKGNAPAIRKGPYAGQELSTDHIIPFAVCPELDCTIANLELLPLTMNGKKRATIGQRQKAPAVSLHKAGLLSAKGKAAVVK